jgi:hypothetical protein
MIQGRNPVSIRRVVDETAVLRVLSTATSMVKRKWLRDAGRQAAL